MKFPRHKHLSVLLALALVGSNMSGAALAQTPAALPQTRTSSAVTTSAVALPAGVERVTSVEGITEYRLTSNGMRVLLFPDETKPTITVNLTYLVGSRHENYGETGMAHLLEHLLFKGSKNHTDIDAEFTKYGASNFNATTSYDRTNYYEIIPATDTALAWALDLEADRMVNSFIAKKDLDSEMTVVRNEFEAGENNPVGIMQQRALSTAYLFHNYGKTVIGARSDIENVSIDRLQAFYRKYYQPDNAVLLLAGRFDEAKALQLIVNKFGNIPRPARTLAPTYTVEPVQDGERTVQLQRVGDVQAVAAVYHVAPGSHADAAPMQILSYVLGSTPSGRLHKALVETKKATNTFGFTFQLAEPGVAFFGTTLRPENSLEDARQTLLTTIQDISKNPPTKEEVDRARTALLKNIELALTSSESVGLILSEWVAKGDWRLFFLNRDRIRNVTPADVQRVAAQYLKESNRTVATFVPVAKPDRAEVPGVPDVAALVKDYKGDAALAAGEAFDSSPANIESRVTRTGEVKTGAPGLEIALLPKRTRGNTVNAVMTLRFGDEQSLVGRSTVASLTGAMLMRGTKTRTRQQIQDELDRLKARINVSGGASSANVSIETVRENLPAVIRLVADVLREPAFDAKEFEQLKQQRLAAIEQGRSEPVQKAINAYQRHINPYPKTNVRYVPTIEEQLAETQAATLDDVKKFYADFYGASYGQLAVVGDFDPKEISALATNLFGDFRTPRPYARIANTVQVVPAVNLSLEAPDKANAFFIAGYNFPLRDTHPDYPALALGSYILGEDGLNSRLAKRIRGKEGLSYGVGGGFNAGALDDFGAFNASGIYAPQNAAKLEAALRDELAIAIKDGFTAEEVQNAKTGFTESRKSNRAENAALARQLNNYLFLDRTLAFDAELERRIQALTPAEVTAAVRKYLDPTKITIIKSGDFAKSAVAPGAIK